ncbi:MAG TPA: Cys-tRNA(Pro) deacylase [Geopsychrobacteraceae bacterium]|nr:Cys-tRNA(Pro) deacylase [Geopsychrobacteraceae bacterium]
MAKEKIPSTGAVRLLKQHKIPFTSRPYRYEEKGGTKVSARELKVDEHQVIKTLVMEDEKQQALIVLMHGDQEVSLKNLARQLDVKQITPCSPVKADRLTGYQTGGISPFGTRQSLPVYVEKGILDLEQIYINGGRRGLLIEISPQDLLTVLKPQIVEVGL